jgi:hypothetical protein
MSKDFTMNLKSIALLATTLIAAGTVVAQDKPQKAAALARKRTAAAPRSKPTQHSRQRMIGMGFRREMHDWDMSALQADFPAFSSGADGRVANAFLFRPPGRQWRCPPALRLVSSGMQPRPGAARERPHPAGARHPGLPHGGGKHHLVHQPLHDARGRIHLCGDRARRLVCRHCRAFTRNDQQLLAALAQQRQNDLLALTPPDKF